MANRYQSNYDRTHVRISQGPDFTDSHIKELLRLGLFHEEVDELRQCLYPLQAWMRPGPSIGPIRAYLASTDKAMKQAEQFLEVLVNPLGQRNTLKELALKPSAQERLALQVCALVNEASADPELLDRAVSAVRSLRTVIADAKGRLPIQQRQRGNVGAINRIYNAWLRGHANHVWDSDGRLRCGNQPKFLGVVTRDDSAPFPQVAQYCFEAVGSKASVDTAIRVYLRLTANRAREDRKRLGFPREQWERVGKRGRPRGRSHNGSRKAK